LRSLRIGEIQFDINEIEYECEEDIALQFHSKAWLDTTAADNNFCIGFIKSDEKTGVLGLPLKTAIIYERLTLP
jgi:hypothetical protein